MQWITTEGLNLYRPLDLFLASWYKIVMKKILGILCILIATPVFAAEVVELGQSDNDKIKFPEQVKTLKGSLLIKDDQMLDELIKLQKEKDMQDIDNLWKGTVENNKVIGFALKKLATPESQRRIHSSLMAKTLSAVIAGSTFVPSMVGSDPYLQTTAFAAGRLAQQLLNRKTMPQEIPLTDTELIQLAGMVEDLQDTIIKAYYSYKSSLSQIKDTRSRLILYHKNYSKAMDSNDILDISISSSLYDNMVMEEFFYQQEAKKYQLELQRLAGKKVVDGLNLYQYNFNSALFKNKEAVK